MEKEQSGSSDHVLNYLPIEKKTQLIFCGLGFSLETRTEKNIDNNYTLVPLWDAS
jgi:hypothetical protein